MAPTNTEVKKGNRKKGGAQKQAELEEEKQHNAELEMQIQGEVERAHEENLIRRGASDLEGEGEEKEMENSLEPGEETMTESPAFSFAIPQPLTAMRKGAAISKPPITSTKISKDTNFLKRSMDDLSFIPEPLTRKNPKTTVEEENSILKQILVKLESLARTVESQTTHILALEKQLEELTMHSKENIQASKES